jgi:hypothetical protein
LIRAAISAPTPKGLTASWTITARPVFSTEASTASSSQGAMVRKSISSTDTPSFSSRAAAAAQSPTMRL